MLDNAKSNLEEQKKQNAILEKKLQQAMQVRNQIYTFIFLNNLQSIYKKVVEYI